MRKLLEMEVILLENGVFLGPAPKACLALQCDGQYITGINDDVVPMKLFSRNFDFDKCVALRLSDKSPEDKLFGFELKKDGGEKSSNEEGSDE